ncbi:MAG TPA: YihY/virulence factor BrkB family protein [Candidatus Pelethosoma merdigallinarum]|nr:YihY/virulence factor BrkB family protein [Candidatus Pelethosoma merdigallinarum]
MEQVKKWLHSLFQIIQVPEMKILPGHIAFFLVLSIIPIITLIGFIASFFSISIESLIQVATNIVPEEIMDLLMPFVTGKGMDMNIGLFMVIGFVLASNGPHAIIVACDTLYDEKDKNYLHTRVKAFVLTILLMLLFFFCLVVLAFGNSILNMILQMDFLSHIHTQLYWAFLFIKYPFAFILIYWIIKMLYTMAPSKKIPSKSVTKGALFTTIMWLIVTSIFSFYISHFGSYDLFYGGLSSIIVMMIWVYILSYVLVIGIAINRNNYHQLEDTSTNN